MAASLLRRARATVVTSLAVRASPYSALRLPQHRLLTDGAEVEVAHCYVGARYSSSSAMSGFKETSLSSMSIFSVSQSKGLSKQTEEDPFDSITERPMRVAEGAGYSLVILAGLAVAGVAAYAVLKELIFEPKEYKIFGKALNRVQNDHQVMVRLGSPITGYGQESRNRAARQRISNRTYVDEDGVERIEANSQPVLLSLLK